MKLSLRLTQFLIAIPVCALIALISGCASVEMSSAAQDAEAKRFSPPPGEANIYVFRRYKYAGSAVPFPTTIDGRIVGALANNTYQLVTVQPGEHVVGAAVESYVPQTKQIVEAGKNYFFQVSVKIGLWQPHFSVVLVPEEEGIKNIMECRRAEANEYK